MDVELREARRLATIYRKLRQGGGTLESTTSSEPLKSAYVKTALRKELAKAESQAVGRTLESTASASPAVAVATHNVMQAAERALDKVERGDEAALTDFEFLALEAIVLVVGRPAVRYTNGRIDTLSDEGENSHWAAIISIARSDINEVSAAVGRIDLAHDDAEDDPLGTAWRLGTDLVVTNRHVARRLVADPAIDPGQWNLDPAKPSVVDFNVTDRATKVRRFQVAELVYCAPEADVDLAILRLDPSGGTLPDPLDLDWNAETIGTEGGGTFTGREIYVVGHPYRLSGSTAVSTVFGRADGFKRWSPGRVTALSAPRPVFEHDCSTLGGNSGSCVLSAFEHQVVGLHYAGLEVDLISDMGRANAALALSQLGNHPAAAILKQGHA